MKAFLSTITAILLSQLLHAQCMNTSNTTALSLNNGVLVGGTANTIGAKYRFSNAASGVDVLVTIVSLTKTGANQGDFTFITTDAASNFAYSAQAAVGGFDNNFQPYWLSAGAYYNTGTTTLEAGFKFELSDASANGTTVIPVYRNLMLESIDNDGGNLSAIIQEEVAYSPSATAYGLNNPTTQVNVAPDTYRGPSTNQPNIGTGASYISYAYYFNTSSFTWYSRHYFTVNSAGNLGEAARLSSLAVDCNLAPANFNFPVLNISGNVFNDVNALNNGKVDGTGIGAINGSPLYVNLVNGSGLVIASTPVAADGTYNFYSVKNQSSYTLQLSTIAGTIGAATPANQLAPNWVHTGQNDNNGSGSDGNITDARISVNVNNNNVNNINFGIQRGPESGFNAQPLLGNPAFFFFVPVPSIAFLLNNVGVTPGTSDYDGGVVDKVRITAFPSNTNAIKIGSTTYVTGATVCPPGVTCQTWPAAGVTINFNTLTGILTPISIDPVDGNVNIVIPFAAIDNGGLEDPTPGSVSQPLAIVLPLKIAAFDVAKNGNTAAITLATTERNPNATVTIERSTNGVNFTALTTMPAGNSMLFQYTDVSPVQNEKNYYRAKLAGANGEVVYTSIKMVRFTQGTRVDVYPVPASDVLNVSWNHTGSNISINLYSPAGQLMLNKQVKEMTSQTALDISRMPAGYYILKVTAGEEVLAQQKIIKQ